MILHRWRGLLRLLFGGDIGGVEAYMDGDWSTPDLTALIELVARNQVTITAGGPAPLLSRLMQKVRYLAQANTIAGSRRNIMQHYDLGNEFYARWLDRGMNYSAALYHDAEADLETAQVQKLDRILERLDVAPDQTILEIGSGWGALAERIAATGAAVTGLTLSPAQLEYAVRRVEGAGLARKVDLRLQDYREVEGSYDRVVSVEMLEAVGEAWWPTYFGMLKARLKPHGTAVLQVITISDERFASYRSSPDFIQTYIFPGGMLPSPGVMQAQIDRAGLVVQGIETFGDGYARTLNVWQERFQAAWPDIAAMGFPLRFKRMWEYYLSYCEAGFRAGVVDVGLWQIGHAS